MTPRSTITGLALVLAGLTLPTAADAAEGFAASTTILRAGPGSDYPRIGRISAGESLEVHGCLDRATWCDVGAGDDRGWMPGSRIAFVRDGRRSRLTGDLALFGLSILTFGRQDYWGAHYRDRSWVNDRRWKRGDRTSPPNGLRVEPGPAAIVPIDRPAPSGAAVHTSTPRAHIDAPARPRPQHQPSNAGRAQPNGGGPTRHPVESGCIPPACK